MAWRLVSAVALILAVAATGCATKFRDIPARTLVKRSATIVERDIRQCDKAITGHLKGPWFSGELEFAACMIARNYQTFVQVLDAPLEVRKASIRTSVGSARVLADLVECDRFVTENVTVLEKIARPVVALAGLVFFPLGVGSSTASPALSIQRERDYTACMAPRGYIVSRWRPDPSASPQFHEGP